MMLPLLTGPSRHFAMMVTPGGRSIAGWKMSSSISWTNSEGWRHENELRFLAGATLGHGVQRIRPDAARSFHLRHDGRHPDLATGPVRLRHQFRSKASARGGSFG